MPQSEYWPFTKGKTAENVEYSDKSAIQKQLGDMEGEVKEMQMELAAIKRDRMDLFSRKQSKGFVLEAEEMLKSSEPHHYSPEENFTKYPEETKKYSDEEITVYKTQIRDMKEEAEELKITLVEKTEQLQEYRIKYLQAQQQVEELKRQLDVIEFDNKQVSDQIQIEIQKMKMQFQEKLQELAPLPDLLKGAQIQLQEAKQLQRLAEDSSQQLSNELHRVKEKLVVAVNNLNQEKVDRSKLTDENKMLKAILDEKTKEIDDLNRILDEYKCKATRNEEKYCQQEIRYKEKSAECSQLARDLDEIKVESNRSLSRCKDRADSMRRYLQTQISELERQLIQSRAHCRACQKERDEIRQRMQIQINNLQENFELVEIRLRALQNQVTSLKNSYTVILADDEEGSELNKISSA
ncbi:spindle pole body component 110-like isoform X4 [Trichoplusia ni]|uniref:Spindle pole body component 110-like isoform X4 n=1 Tax=Trichoplusia ni TaxID=7111 RepID=A0A7E5VHI0_TRINI|nr:spindle pole body component 110-like isoform X4 [Trichoplusia ni]